MIFNLAFVEARDVRALGWEFFVCQPIFESFSDEKSLVRGLIGNETRHL